GLVDAFTAADGHAVLLSQIQAGGVGLNMQAASVVILCEPQIKPTTEHQAVARVHRMGQIRTVRVHRLLSADSVDQRMLDILARKERLFDAYARRSDVAETTPDAVDVSEGELARRIVEEEQRRLAAPTDG
ncbi:helicase-related protein, partial [Streptomyces sp. DT225]